jgi:hypothetical protein
MTVESKSGRTPSVLIRGDYYDSAYGPTILLVMMSSAACKWLQRLFRDLAELGVPRIFTAEPGIHLENIGEIKMVRRSSGPLVSIRREPGRSNDSEQSFEWSATDDAASLPNLGGGRSRRSTRSVLGLRRGHSRRGSLTAEAGLPGERLRSTNDPRARPAAFDGADSRSSRISV